MPQFRMFLSMWQICRKLVVLLLGHCPYDSLYS